LLSAALKESAVDVEQKSIDGFERRRGGTAMNKPLLGLLLGGILGVFDGLSALLSAPEVAPVIVGIVIGSTFKGVLVGVVAGMFARKVNSVPLGIAFGAVVGLALAYGVVAAQKASGQTPYYWEIMLPGSIVGMIVGYATQRYGSAPARRAASV